MGTPRRNFLRHLATVTAAATLAPSTLARLLGHILSSHSSTTTPLDRFLIRLADYPALQTVEGSVKIPVPNPDGGVARRIIVTRMSLESFAAVDDVCTHAGCLVETYRKQLGGLPCPCHGALFRPTGEVLRGPAARPLPQFATFYTPGSDILEVEIPGSSTVPTLVPSCTLAPNPASDWLELCMTTPTAGIARFRILNLHGQQLVEWQQHIPAEHPFRIRYPLEGFASGTYWLSVEWATAEPLVQSFVVLR